MLIATWNVNSLRVRLPHLKDWLAANPVDVLALQETKTRRPEFPARGDRGARAASRVQRATHLQRGGAAVT